jgi:DNA repair exonuclease SbcCD ATPase subunit
MKFIDTTIDNFLTIGHAKIQLDGRGLNLVQGVNTDDSSAASNGAGKSSIVDAIFWCNYGQTAREVKGDAVVNRTAKKGTRVMNRVQVGENVYRITRHRKHAENKNALHLHAEMKDGSLVDLSRGTDADTQKEVEKILGATVEVFQAAVYAGQEAMPDLPRMTDRNLKSLIEEAAGLQRIERSYALARSRLTTAKNLMDNALTKEDSIKVSQVRTESALQTRRERMKSWDASRETTLAGLLGRVDGAKANATTAALHAQGLKTHSETATARLAEIAVELAAHATLAATARQKMQAAGAAERAVERHALTTANEKVKVIKAQIENAEAELSKPCTECGTPGSLANIDEFKEHKQKHLAAATEALRTLALKVRTQVAAHAAAEAEVAEAAKAVPDVSALEAERNEKQAVVNEFKNALQAAQQAKRVYDQEKMTHDNAAAQKNPEAEVVAELEERMKEEVAQLAAVSAEIDKAIKAVQVAEDVVKVFGPAGVRAQILDTVTPFLNDRTANYLSVLSDGNMTAIWTTLTKSATGDLKEKFSIDVNHSKGGDNFAAISGGEKRKVRLACALALQDLVASRATQPIDLWIGDEVDDALDEAGLERLMVILERKARERGTVLVISHSDLRDWIDNQTTVTKADGYSTVEGSLCD